MVNFPRVMRFMVGIVCLVYCSPLLAETSAPEKKQEVKKPATGKFIRVRRDAQDQPLALETAIVRYLPASGQGGLTVDLISAVHVGDRSYYEQLNKQMEQYDVVLYELVAPPGTRIPKGGKRGSDNPISMLQQIMKIVLELDSQVERIDYTKKNFIHADLSPDQMAEEIRKRGDDGFTLFLSITADMLRQKNLQELDKANTAPPKEEEDTDFLSLLLDPDGPVKLKRMMAEQMANIESPEGGLGNTVSTILISDRNKAALKVFQKELAQGKKKIAIFYGAGHMADFEKRLGEDFGLKRDSEQWLTAWDIQPKERTIEDLLEIIKSLTNEE